MTPHHSDYYQKGGTPHDSESPVPVSFLAVPAGSAFDFHVVCHTSRLPPTLRAAWRSMLDASFARAFDQLGFGAKTSVGYRAMSKMVASGGQQMPTESVQATVMPGVALDHVWDKAQLKFNMRNGTLTAIGPKNEEANALAPRGEELLASLPWQVQEKVRQDQYVRVTASIRGAELVGVKVST